MVANSFESFDPLSAKNNATSDVQARAIKREITNILKSYVGWYDPLCEMLQNALDSVEERAQQKSQGTYIPQVFVTLDIKNNSIIITDNGVGLGEKEFKSFLAPDFSFKSGDTRGRKGVGATFLAYGFNYLQVSTKTPEFIATGRMTGARKWVFDQNPAGNPEVITDPQGPIDNKFHSLDRGVSICVKLDKETYPADLAWIQVDKADEWMKILRIKTPLGAIIPRSDIVVNLEVIDKNGNSTSTQINGISYLRPHLIVTRSESIDKIIVKRDELYKKGKNPDDLPAAMKNLDAFWCEWTSNTLLSTITLDDTETDILTKYSPTIYGVYVYSTKVWDAFNESLGVRGKQKVLYAGIQIGAQNMPQGELIEVPLRRNIGRQHNVHFMVHFPECEADYGRKGFQAEIVNFSKSVCSRLVDNFSKYNFALRPTTGASGDLHREESIASWKDEMEKYEKENPLVLKSDIFFQPTKEISITSKPNREQDVIALFNQLVAGGVIRGLRVMSTNERQTYDCLYRILINEPTTNHIWNKTTNPLGILPEIAANYIPLPFVTKPRVLEYKLTLDGLIEDIECGNKNSNDISLVVVWKTGDNWQENYKITSLLDENNLSIREYHGVTHIMTNLTTGQKEMDLIVLEELVDFLNDPISTIKNQIDKYENI